MESGLVFFWTTRYIIKGDMFVCLFVCIYVPYGRPNGWADRDHTWHTHSCPPRECFCQGQCQGHSCMREGVTELRNTRKATPGEYCSYYVRRTGEATSGERLRNSGQTTDNYSSSNEARRRRRRAASAEGASRTPSGGRVTTASIVIMELITNNTNWKHFEELKWLRLTACVLSIDETRNTISTKQLRKNYHQQHSPKHQHIFNTWYSSFPSISLSQL